MKGNKFEFKAYELDKALKVFAWSFGSVVVTFLIALVASAEVPVEYVMYIPLINTILYSIKQYVQDNTAQ